MPLCTDACSVAVPEITESCELTRAKGGSCRFILASCEVELSDLTDDIVTWCDAIAADQIKLSPEIVSEIPEASFTETLVSSCRPEQPTGAQYSYNFESYGANLSTFEEYDYWNLMMEKQAFYSFGYIDGEGNFVGWYEAGTWSTKNSRISPKTQKESAFWKGTVSWFGLGQMKPRFIADLVTTIINGCP